MFVLEETPSEAPTPLNEGDLGIDETPPFEDWVESWWLLDEEVRLDLPAEKNTGIQSYFKTSILKLHYSTVGRDFKSEVWH